MGQWVFSSLYEDVVQGLPQVFCVTRQAPCPLWLLISSSVSTYLDLIGMLVGGALLSVFQDLGSQPFFARP
jgi:hypothetical protein